VIIGNVSHAPPPLTQSHTVPCLGISSESIRSVAWQQRSDCLARATFRLTDGLRRNHAGRGVLAWAGPTNLRQSVRRPIRVAAEAHAAVPTDVRPLMSLGRVRPKEAWRRHSYGCLRIWARLARSVGSPTPCTNPLVALDGAPRNGAYCLRSAHPSTSLVLVTQGVLGHGLPLTSFLSRESPHNLVTVAHPRVSGLPASPSSTRRRAPVQR
jgi:hypothetical protein